MSTTGDAPPAPTPYPVPPLWPAVALACVGLVGTGLLAGGMVALGLAGAYSADAHQGAIVFVLGLGGGLGCLGLLAACWSPLGRSASRTSSGWPAVTAALGTAVLLPVTIGLTIQLAAGPYGARACGADSAPFCAMGIVLWVPTVGAVVPWTLAGLPGLLTLWFEAVRMRRRVYFTP